MLPEDYIVSWKKEAPWRLGSQVEQDLILSRLLVELFSNKIISENLLFRGGTALSLKEYGEIVTKVIINIRLSLFVNSIKVKEKERLFGIGASEYWAELN